MVTIIFVEGMHDSYFFLNLLEKFKNFLSVEIDACKSIYPLYYYFRNNPNRFIVKKEGEYYIIVEGRGRSNVTKLFINTVKELAKSPVEIKSVLLIIDEDTDSDPRGKIMEQISSIAKILDGFKTSNPESYKHLSHTKITRGSRHFKAGSVDIKPSLENVLATLIKNHNIIPDNLRKFDDDGIILNAISYLGVNNYEGLCKYLFSEKYSIMKEELTRIGLTETICEFI